MDDAQTAVITYRHEPHAAGLVGASPQIERAVQRLRERLSGVGGFTDWIRVDLDGGAMSCFIFGLASELRFEAPSSPVVATIGVRSSDLLQMIDGQFEPRSGLLFGQLAVSGSIPEALRFCDGLCGLERRPFIYSSDTLPKPTTDVARAKRDLAEFGYCLVKDALSPDLVARLRARLTEQAAAEAEAGVGAFDGGPDLPNQRVWNLINKGAEFHELLHEPVVDAFVPDLLGSHFIISSYSANIAGPGGRPQMLHYDQISMQPQAPGLMTGLNLAWFLDDVTEANGGTRVMPGSGNPGAWPADPTSIEGTVAAAAPAGSAFIWDSRVWHGTGSNRTRAKRHVILLFFNRYFMRSQENFGLSLLPEVAETLSDRAKVMLGFRCTGSLGGVEGPVEGRMVERPATPIGRMVPAVAR